MGRPPNGGGPAFRFTQNEVVEMEACLQQVNNALPSRETVNALAAKFSCSPDRVGKPPVQPKQVWNWFQNRRYAQRAKVAKPPTGKLSISPMPREPSSSASVVTSFVNVAPPSVSAPLGKNNGENNNGQVEFEARSARDGAWYDVAVFLSHRKYETGDPEVRVRFSGFGVEEDEWVNVRKYVRQRSLPCENAECVAVLPGDLILCFQEGKEQALYFDAHVLDAQRRRHDVRGCHCRFLVRYDHDQSEEIVPLRKVCRRPETDYRLQVLQSSRTPGSSEQKTPTPNDHSLTTSSNDFNMACSPSASKQRKVMDVNTDEVSTVPTESEKATPDAVMEDAATADTASIDKQDGTSTSG